MQMQNSSAKSRLVKHHSALEQLCEASTGTKKSPLLFFCCNVLKVCLLPGYIAGRCPRMHQPLDLRSGAFERGFSEAGRWQRHLEVARS